MSQTTELAVLDEGIQNVLIPQLELLGIDEKTVLREMNFAAQILSKNEYLAKCPRESIINSILNAVQCGLTLSPVAKEAYLVPRKGLCCLDPSYIGLAKTITDTGAAKHNVCEVVYQNDDYLIDKASDEKVKRHIDACLIGKQRGKPIACYSVFTLADGTKHMEFSPVEGKDGIYETARRRSESYKYYLNEVAQGRAATCVWVTDEEQMLRKSMIKRHVSKMPRSSGDWTKVDLLVATDNIDYSLEAGQDKISHINKLIGYINEHLYCVLGKHPDYSPQMNKIEQRLGAGVSGAEAEEITDFIQGIINNHNRDQFALTGYKWDGIYLRDGRAIHLIKINNWGKIIAVFMNDEAQDTKQQAAVTMQELYDSQIEEESTEETEDPAQTEIF